MQTAKDATFLTILILILASVRIGPVQADPPGSELPLDADVKQASMLDFGTADAGIGPWNARPAQLPRVAAAEGPKLLEAPMGLSISKTPVITDSIQTEIFDLDGWVAIGLNREPETETLAAATSKTAVRRWIQVEERLDAIEGKETRVVVHLEEVLEELADLAQENSKTAFADLVERAQESATRLPCPKVQFEVTAAF